MSFLYSTGMARLRDVMVIASFIELCQRCFGGSKDATNGEDYESDSSSTDEYSSDDSGEYSSNGSDFSQSNFDDGMEMHDLL